MIDYEEWQAMWKLNGAIDTSKAKVKRLVHKRERQNKQACIPVRPLQWPPLGVSTGGLCSGGLCPEGGSLSRRESVYKGGSPYPLPVDRQTPVKTLPSLAVGQNVERLVYISIT